MKIILTVFALVFIVGFGWAQNASHAQMNIQKISVDEVLQTKNYTYLHGKVDGDAIWVALPKIEASVGDEFYYQQGIEMREFKSTELKKTFDVVWFIQGVDKAQVVQGNAGGAQANQQTSMQNDPHKPKSVNEKSDIKIDPAEGCITIAELFKNKKKYKDKTVSIKGRVVKYNSNIMGKNWIHLQDGTNYSDEFDLTITSDMDTKIDEILIIKGKISLDKNFGYGYFYKILMEDGMILD